MSSEIATTRPPLWRVCLRLGRVSNLPTVWSNCVAGMCLAGRPPDVVTLAIIAGAVSFFYVGGMFLNDGFDRDFDRRFRPERPIPSGEISSSAVFAIGFAFLLIGQAVLVAFSIGIAGRPSAELLVSAFALAALIVYYDAHHKQNPLSPLVMALCRMMVYVVSASAVASSVRSEVLLGAAVLTAYVIGLSYVARQENLREIQNLWPLLFLVAPLVHGLPLLWRSGEGLVALALLVGVAGYALRQLTARSEGSIPRAVVTLIAGISLVDAILISGTPEAAIWSGFALFCFVLTLFLQRFVPGT